MCGKVLYTLAGGLVGALAVMLLRPGGAVLSPGVDRAGEGEVRLAQPIADLSLDQVPFDEAVAALARAAGTPIDVDWPALDAAHLNRKTPVNLRARGIPLDDALDRLLDPAGDCPALDGLVYTAESGHVLITTDGRVGERLVLRVYDVRDLLGPEPPADSKDAVEQVSGPQPHGLFGPWEPDAYYPPFVSAEARYAQGAGQLEGWITSRVEPDRWWDGRQSRAGSLGSVSVRHGRMIVENTWRVQHRVRKALARLREVVPIDAPRPSPGGQEWRAEVGQWVSLDGRPTEAALRRVIPEINFDGVRLEVALATLGRLAGAVIYLDLPTLQEKGFCEGLPIRLRLRNVSLGEALDLVLRSQDDQVPLGYAPTGGMITVSTEEWAKTQTLTRAYRLREWLGETRCSTPYRASTTRRASPVTNPCSACSIHM